MRMFLDTSTPLTKLFLISDSGEQKDFEWESGRDLSKGLLLFIKNNLNSIKADFSDLTAVAIYKGPGSFTGLRIGVTVMNTLADSLDIPIVGSTGEDWLSVAQQRLNDNENDKIVLPFYGAEANITTPRK